MILQLFLYLSVCSSYTSSSSFVFLFLSMPLLFLPLHFLSLLFLAFCLLLFYHLFVPLPVLIHIPQFLSPLAPFVQSLSVLPHLPRRPRTYLFLFSFTSICFPTPPTPFAPSLLSTFLTPIHSPFTFPHPHSPLLSFLCLLFLFLLLQRFLFLLFLTPASASFLSLSLLLLYIFSSSSFTNFCVSYSSSSSSSLSSLSSPMLEGRGRVRGIIVGLAVWSSWRAGVGWLARTGMCCHGHSLPFISLGDRSRQLFEYGNVRAIVSHPKACCSGARW